MIERIKSYIIAHYQVYFFSKKDFYLALAPLLFSFIIYLTTLHPSLASGDSGELSMAVKYLGIPHAPGYSLLILLSKPFMYIPHGNVAWRLNVFSAFCASFTVFFSFLLMLKLLMSLRIERTYAIFSAIFSSMSFALSKTFWTQAGLFEVYTLASVFYPIFFLILFKWFDEIILHHKDKELYLGDRLIMTYGFLFGLGVVAHLTTLMTEVVGIWFILSALFIFIFSSPYREKGRRGVSYIVALLTFTLLGYGMFYTEIIRLDVSTFDEETFKNGLMWFCLSQGALFFFYVYDRYLVKNRYEKNNFFKRFYYLSAKSFAAFYLGYLVNVYVFIRSYANPLINWGGLSDENSFLLRFAKFLNFLWRKQYGSQGKLPFTWDNFLDEVKANVLIHNGQQYTPFLYALMVIGLFQIFRKNVYLGLSLMVSFLGFNLQLILYLRIDVYSRLLEVSDVFFIFSYFCISLFIGLGISLVLEWVEKGLRMMKRSH